ncbi:MULTISPECIES: CPCC family cysteine-rich protein [unclassified Bacillus (in: firmicutes)]|uniref:CPCC family cysteine-rich protein n=1 Tax=unclassified Bacillus (in: firmicutes) TaxID=185979 RepID=UPI000BF1B2E1|nr:MULTISPECIES: CPCC family cysteine-rich protein [unclassified Bacillus (in: firmicutes)]PEJ52357.1 hydrolase [Bacillus sp. AFS002410]PEL14272.1 hydrolase [Bacillus sp. AFS017336]
MKKLYPCPCCGNKTLEEEERESYEICQVCFWEDDIVQNEDEEYEGGANKLSLKQAKENFKKYRVSDLRFTDKVKSKM